MKRMNFRIPILLIFAASVYFASVSFIADPEHWNCKRKTFLKGYDLVSYFDGSAQKGSKEFRLEWQGKFFQFTNQKHLEDFQNNPEQYMPQYGGWCAYAMALEPKKVKVNPKAFKIVDGKLYLFYKKIWANTLKKWNEFPDEQKAILNANTNWYKLASDE